MPGIFSAFTDAQKAGQEFGDSVAASKDLQQAMQETPKDESGKADLFTTYSKAAQNAMQSGQVRVADKLLKQANEYKGDALKLKLDEMKVQSAQLERFEQHIQGLNTPEEFIDSIKHSELPLDQQMQLMTLAQKDPKQFKDLMLKQSMTGKERAQVEMKVLEEQRKKTHDEAQIAHWANQDRNQAGRATGKQTPEEKEAAVELHEDVRGIRADAKSEIDATNKNYGLNDAQKAAKIVGIKKRRDDAIKAARDEFKHRDDEESPEPGKAKPTKEFNLTPAIKAQVEKIDIKNLLKVADDPKERESFDQHYGQPGLADALIKDSKTEAPAPKKEVESPLPKKPGYRRVKGNRGWKYEKLVGRLAAAYKEGL